jgi:hypothetical protein
MVLYVGIARLAGKLTDKPNAKNTFTVHFTYS